MRRGAPDVTPDDFAPIQPNFGAPVDTPKYLHSTPRSLLSGMASPTVMIGSSKLVFVLLIFVDEPETVKVPEDKLVTVFCILPVVAFIKRVPVVIVTLGPNNCNVPELELFHMRKSVELLKSDPLEPTFKEVLTGTLTLLLALRLILENAKDALPEDTVESKKLPFEVVLTRLV